MTAKPVPYPLPGPLRDVIDSALGRTRRPDPVSGRTGGPAGNAELTAAIGLLLLVLFAAELVTLLNVTGMITWHIAIGAILIPPALAKTGSTGWRILRYYTGVQPYRQAGPPPLLLRLLGPLVVAGTIAVLGSGLAVSVLGPDAGRSPLITALGQQVSPLTIHQASFVVWGVVTGLHVLARIAPAVRLVSVTDRRHTTGGAVRVPILLLTLAAGAVAAALVLAASQSWIGSPAHPF